MRKLFRTIILTLIVIFYPFSFSFAQSVKTGSIKGVSVKWTTGSVRIVKEGNGYAIKLGSNFKTKKGPALYVYLGNEKPEKRIAKLKAVSGAQSYMIPDKTDIRNYTRVFIYCVPFKAIFGAGHLQKP